MNLKRVLLVGLIGATAIGAGVGLQWWRGSQSPAVTTADAGPQKTIEAILHTPLPMLAGGEKKLADALGAKFTVVNFWATWCAPCREEMPMFEALYKELSPKGTQFLGVAIDRVDPANRFVREIGVSYPNFVGDVAMLEATKHLGNDKQALPFSVILDAKGKIVLTKLGKLSEVEIRALSTN